MNNAISPYAGKEVSEMLDRFNSDTLADVLRVWDCNSQAWFDNQMIVFRFEMNDLLIWNEKGILRSQCGAVDTQVFESDIVTDESSACLVWRADPQFSSLIGKATLSATLQKRIYEALSHNDQSD